MSTSDHNLSREERLAAKLRENLRRRKSQAKAIAGTGTGTGAGAGTGAGSGMIEDGPPLPKDKPKV